MNQHMVQNEQTLQRGAVRPEMIGIGLPAGNNEELMVFNVDYQPEGDKALEKLNKVPVGKSKNYNDLSSGKKLTPWGNTNKLTKFGPTTVYDSATVPSVSGRSQDVGKPIPTALKAGTKTYNNGQPLNEAQKASLNGNEDYERLKGKNSLKAVVTEATDQSRALSGQSRVAPGMLSEQTSISSPGAALIGFIVGGGITLALSLRRKAAPAQEPLLTMI